MSMKKLCIPATIVALVAVGVCFGHATATPSDESDLLLANAEALAQDDEGGSSTSWLCWSQSKSSNGGFWRCGNPCTWIDAAKGEGSEGRCYK